MKFFKGSGPESQVRKFLDLIQSRVFSSKKNLFTSFVSTFLAANNLKQQEEEEENFLFVSQLINMFAGNEEKLPNYSGKLLERAPDKHLNPKNALTQQKMAVRLFGDLNTGQMIWKLE